MTQAKQLFPLLTSIICLSVWIHLELSKTTVYVRSQTYLYVGMVLILFICSLL
jgi:hypothetical protein